MSGGTVYRYTLEEYNAMNRELEALNNLSDRLLEMRNEASGPDSRHYRESLQTLRNRLQHLNSSYGWQGADAESYKGTAREIISELATAAEAYIEALEQADRREKERRNELVRMIAACENGQMELGDAVTVQVMLAAQDLVDGFEKLEGRNG